MRRWLVLAAVLVLGIAAVVAWRWPAATPLVASPTANDAPAVAEQPPTAEQPVIAEQPAIAEQPVASLPEGGPGAAPASGATPLTVVAPTVASNGHLTIRLLGHTTGP